jgi:hypothetical protein
MQAVLMQAVLMQAVLMQAVLMQAVLMQAVLMQTVLMQAVLMQAVRHGRARAGQRRGRAHGRTCDAVRVLACVRHVHSLTWCPGPGQWRRRPGPGPGQRARVSGAGCMGGTAYRCSGVDTRRVKVGTLGPSQCGRWRKGYAGPICGALGPSQYADVSWYTGVRWYTTLNSAPSPHCARQLEYYLYIFVIQVFHPYFTYRGSWSTTCATPWASTAPPCSPSSTPR